MTCKLKKNERVKELKSNFHFLFIYKKTKIHFSNKSKN